MHSAIVVLNGHILLVTVQLFCSSVPMVPVRAVAVLNLCPLGNFPCIFVVCWFFQINFFENFLLGIPSECHTVWFQIISDVLSGLIWVQTVCKCYQQTTLVGKELKSEVSSPHFRALCFNQCFNTYWDYGKRRNPTTSQRTKNDWHGATDETKIEEICKPNSSGVQAYVKNAIKLG